MNKLLQLDNVAVHFGGVHALQGVDVVFSTGECVALMGPNGAGKSTILKTIFGLIPNYSGEIFWRGKKINPVPHLMTGLGIALVPQGRRVFPSLSILENIEVGGMYIGDSVVLKERIAMVLDFFPGLKKKKDKKGGMLSGGEQQMLSLARALVTDPRMILLDEPTLGLSPKVVGEVFEKIHEIKRVYSKTIILVEHNIKTALTVCDRVYILANGRVVKEEPAARLMKSGALEEILLNE
jgi:branched-chain amino acid transport system ATP-binding protein